MGTNKKKGFIWNVFFGALICFFSFISVTHATTTTGTQCPANTKLENGLCLPTFGPTGGFAGAKDLDDLTVKIIKFFLYAVGGTAVIFVMWGGYTYITAGGNEENSEKSKKTLVNAIIGVVVVILAFVIVNIVAKTLTT